MTQSTLMKSKNQKEEIINLLINEAITGVTKMDTSNNSGRYFWCPEAEAMYFKSVRDFFENSISKMVMERNHDIPNVKILKNKINLLNKI